MSHLEQDFRVALRWLRRSPSFTFVATITLALGIGATTTIFSVLFGVLLRPLGMNDPSQLAVVNFHREGNLTDATGFSPAYFLDLGERIRGEEAVEHIAGYYFDSATLLEDGEAKELGYVLRVDGSFFDVVDVKPVLGRALDQSDVVPGALGVTCVISESVWRSRFGSDPEILGRTLILDERPVEVVGVMPQDVPLPQSSIELWLPHGWQPDDYELTGRISALARLAPETTLTRGESRLRAYTPDLRAAHPRFADYTITLGSLHETLVGAARPAILLSAGACGLILLIACANIANLLLSRAASRERELATRRALGARGRQLVSQLLTESLTLAAIGGMAGLVLAVVLHRALLSLAPAYLPRIEAVRLDLPVLLFALAASAITGIVFGLAPIFYSLRLDLVASMAAGARAARLSPAWMRHGLVIAQVAVAVTLLVGAALMSRSFLELRAVDPGFVSAGVGGGRIYLDDDSYRNDDEEAFYFEQLLERIRARPGIEAAGATSGLPMDPMTIDYDLPYTLPGQEESDSTARQAFFRAISAGYFETLEIPLLRGRTIADTDRADGEVVAVINETFAETGWPGQDPVGKSFFIYGGRRELRVVGVVGDVRFATPGSPFKAEFFVSSRQFSYGSMTVVARAERAEDATAAVVAAAKEMDRSQPVHSTFTLEGLSKARLGTDRFLTLLLLSLAACALLVSAAGIYGVISYWIHQSQQEIGVRLAVGASGSRIVRSIVGRSVAIAGLGLLIGLGSSLYLARSLESFLFEIVPTDAPALATVLAVLGAVVVVASLLPALAAARLDPVRALRFE